MAQGKLCTVYTYERRKSPLWAHMVHLARTGESGDSMARAVIKRGNSPVQYRKYEKNMLPKHNQGAQMHSMHGRQNFEAYWNFSLTFPEVLAFFPKPSLSLPSQPRVRGSHVSDRTRGETCLEHAYVMSRLHVITA